MHLIYGDIWDILIVPDLREPYSYSYPFSFSCSGSGRIGTAGEGERVRQITR